MDFPSTWKGFPPKSKIRRLIYFLTVAYNSRDHIVEFARKKQLQTLPHYFFAVIRMGIMQETKREHPLLAPGNQSCTYFFFTIFKAAVSEAIAEELQRTNTFPYLFYYTEPAIPHKEVMSSYNSYDQSLRHLFFSDSTQATQAGLYGGSLVPPHHHQPSGGEPEAQVRRNVYENVRPNPSEYLPQLNWDVVTHEDPMFSLQGDVKEKKCFW
ncbi:uncharacterized protein LOC109281713 [Alligator mississippiensis]|uniref:uncharacterized protein LOC109281713 n=1 Tax=Alligator mississippiensis TaxID=8496 RepID=UPI002877EB8D|nr:uncharacterized protein LOC109281713 [Alligator mississippiensis]